MATKIEVFADKDCTVPLADLGEIEVGEKTKLAFYVKNMGNTYLFQPEIDVTFPGVTKVTASIPKELKPGQTFKGSIEFDPEETEEGKKKGTVHLRAKSVGTESVL